MSEVVMPDYTALVRQLFAQAYTSPYLLAPLPEQANTFMALDTMALLKGAARAVYAELLTAEPEKWRAFWFLVEPTYLRLFRNTDTFIDGANQRWLYLMYLQFCQEFPELAPVTPVTPLDDILGS